MLIAESVRERNLDDDHGDAPAERAEKCQEGPELYRDDAGAQDEPGSREPDGERRDAPDADHLAQHDHRGHGGEQRRREVERRDLGERDHDERHEKAQLSAAVDQAAKRVQAEAWGPQVPQAVAQNHGREYEQAEDGAKEVDLERMEIGPEQADQGYHGRAQQGDVPVDVEKLR